MATDIIFDFYGLFVENLFGSVGVSILAMAAILVLIMALMRTSWTFMIYWLTFFLIVMGTMYFGAIALVLSFIMIFSYTAYNFIRLLFRVY